MKVYKDYKNSHFSGLVPSDWRCLKLRHAYNIIGSGTTPEAGNPEYYHNGTISWLNTGDLNNSILKSCTKKVTQKALDDFTALKVFPKHSLAIAMYGATIGKVSLLEFETTVNQACCVFSNSEVVSNEFMFYWFLAHTTHIINLSKGGGQPNINKEILCSLKILCPSVSEQNQIVQYLDHKSAQIDKLIRDKEELIELLNEERTAIINQAVTKGLSPDVPMRDSGIGWLGEVPQNWTIKRLKYLLEEGKEGIKIGPFGSALKTEFIREVGVKVYGQEHVIKNDFSLGNKNIDNDKFSELSKYQIFGGDIVVTMMGTTGKAKVVPEGIPSGIMDSHLTRIRVNKMLLLPRLLELLINDSYLISTQVKLQSKGAIMDGLNSTIIKSLIIPTPPPGYQEELVEYLDEQLEKYSETYKKIHQEIELLKEYKTALISEVVTGKVDVRDEVIEATQASLVSS